MSRYTIQSAIKVLDTLFTFASSTTLSMEEIAERTQQSKNQTFRCIHTLKDYGLIVDRDEGYALTPMVLRLMPSSRHEPVSRIADPYLREFQARTDETVNLVIRWKDREAIILATYPSRHSVRLVSQTGQVSLLHAGATPKAMLAFLSDDEVERVISPSSDLPKYTPFTQTDPVRLRAEVAEIRERGYSISDQDFELGGRGVGAPVFDRSGKPIAGISVGGPISRVGEDVYRVWGQWAVDVAKAISIELGWSENKYSINMLSSCGYVSSGNS